LTAFIKLKPDDPKFEMASEAVFKSFDLDTSGNVDEKEFRDLLHVIHPEMPRTLFLTATGAIRHLYDHDGHLQVGTFTDAMMLAFRTIETEGPGFGYRQDEKTAEELKQIQKREIKRQLSRSSLKNMVKELERDDDISTKLHKKVAKITRFPRFGLRGRMTSVQTAIEATPASSC